MLQNIMNFMKTHEGGLTRIGNFLFFLFLVYLVLVREDLKFALVGLIGWVWMIADRYQPRS